MRTKKLFLAAASVAALLLSTLSATNVAQAANSPAALGEIAPKITPVRGVGQGLGYASGTYRGTGDTTFHGGKVMTAATTNVYVIWYGNWATTNATNALKRNIINGSLAGIGGSAYYNINTTYTDGSGNAVKNSVTYNQATGQYTPGGTYKKTLADRDIASIVKSAITGNKLPLDANGVYFVFTSSDISLSSGFLTRYCGWHTYQNVNGTSIKYSFVGDASKKLSACTAQTTSPNGDAGADGMVSVIAHELEEAVTDPELNAWYDSTGYENADKCAWYFGTTSTATNGSKYNVEWNGMRFLVQQNWVNTGATSHCDMSY